MFQLVGAVLLSCDASRPEESEDISRTLSNRNNHCSKLPAVSEAVVFSIVQCWQGAKTVTLVIIFVLQLQQSAQACCWTSNLTLLTVLLSPQCPLRRHSPAELGSQVLSSKFSNALAPFTPVSLPPQSLLLKLPDTLLPWVPTHMPTMGKLKFLWMGNTATQSHMAPKIPVTMRATADPLSIAILVVVDPQNLERGMSQAPEVTLELMVRRVRKHLQGSWERVESVAKLLQGNLFVLSMEHST